MYPQWKPFDTMEVKNVSRHHAQRTAQRPDTPGRPIRVGDRDWRATCRPAIAESANQKPHIQRTAESSNRINLRTDFRYHMVLYKHTVLRGLISNQEILSVEK